jgi:hypothetical protein
MLATSTVKLSYIFWLDIVRAFYPSMQEDNAAEEFRIYHIAMNCPTPLTMHWKYMNF